MQSEPGLTQEMVEDDKALDEWWREYEAREERRRTNQETLEDKHHNGTKHAEQVTGANVEKMSPARPLKIFAK